MFQMMSCSKIIHHPMETLMSGMIKPRAPSPGWEKRWIVEAANLIPQAPLAVILIFAGIVVSGCLTNLETGMPLGISTFILTFVSFYVGSAASCLGMRLMGESEGYVERVTQIRPILDVFRSSFLLIFLLSGVAGLVSGMAEMIVANVQMEIQPRAPVTFSRIAASGSDCVTSAILFASVYGFIAMPCMMMLDVGYQRGLALSRIAVGICVDMVLKSYIVVIPAAYVVTSLPFFINIPLTIFFVFWVYVAGREIFGGITGNRQKDRVFSLKEA